MGSETNAPDFHALPSSKAELVELILRERGRIDQAIAGLSAEKIEAAPAGAWSIKDHLAHLTAWEQFMLRHYLQGRPAHEAMEVDQETMEASEEDDLNAIIYRRNRERPVSSVLGEFRRSHKMLLEALQEIPFEALLEPVSPDDPERTPRLAYVTGNTYEHYQEHGATIRTLIEKNGS